MADVQCKDCKVTSVDLQISVAAPDTKTVAALPAADFLVVTWTAAETGAMATVFGDGLYRFDGADENNFTPLVLPGLVLPAQEQCHAHFFLATVNGRQVVCLKSEFHPKAQTAATTTFFQKIIGTGAEPKFKYVVTSGTSGGIWETLDVGDVVVTNKARYGLTMPVEKQAMIFHGVEDVLGTDPPAGFASWYDYVNAEILAKDACLTAGLTAAGGRKAASGPASVSYEAPGAEMTDVVTNSRISDDEYGRIATYRTLGATLDENDAYVAEAFSAVSFSNWVSIRNISDLPSPVNNDAQYETFGYCSSLAGAYAIWAFVMGH
jgi:hypothetical protein